VRGYPVGKIAAHLGIDRHTIKKWKRAAHFVEAMENLRREMTAAIISPAAKANPPPRAMDPLLWTQTNARLPKNDDDHDDDDFDDDGDEEEEMSDEEAAETEAWIEQIIAAKREGREIPPPPPPRGSI
jgi:hypothetical protein